ncbi:MAG: selenocysteine-specific translation elongation factor [Deltaproteobacteria bacterium]|nr:selenocysteine-specific translation elongation factor [Deltaproteobacteria bacterium]MBW2019209.1 selenocysteine-specific translation elongation factor [Deltaproteobacteria bacterium]MBW2074015.1 selenocysteine-specific translation elongation factor [Deltaproteobacteria bacterium]
MGNFITVGIAGHVDHGKTSLVKCLTGIDTDRLREEKERGLSIESGIAPLTLPSGKRIAFVDVPGHKDFFKNTIRGLSMTDMAILVLAADDGVMPQTKEHLEILKFMGCERGVVVLSKADLVDKELLELAVEEVRELTAGSFLEGRPIIPFSAVDQRGKEIIVNALEEECKEAQGKDPNGPFRMHIDQMRLIKGYGTVVSGTILSGKIGKEDLIEIYPDGKKARVRYVQVHHQEVDMAYAGQRVGINLPNIKLKEIKRGMVLLAETGMLRAGYLINGRFHYLSGQRKPLNNRSRVKLYTGTAVSNALMVFMGCEVLNPGEKAMVQFRLLERMAPLIGDRYVVCSMNPQSVIGGGVVLDITDRKFRPAHSNTIRFLEAIESRNIARAIENLFADAMESPLQISEIVDKTRFPKNEVKKVVDGMVDQELVMDCGEIGYFSTTQYLELKNRLPKVLDRIHQTHPLKSYISKEEVRAKVAPKIHPSIFNQILKELQGEGKILVKNESIQRPGFVPRPNHEQQQIIDSIVDFAAQSGYVPFSLDKFWRACERRYDKEKIQKMANFLCSRNQLIRLNDSRFISSEKMDDIKRKIEKHITEKGALTLQDSKEILGFGRTGGVPVLEHLDTIGLTMRTGNIRVLKNQSMGVKVP